MKFNADLYSDGDILLCVDTKWGPAIGFIRDMDRESVAKNKKQVKLVVINHDGMWKEIKNFAEKQIKLSGKS